MVLVEADAVVAQPVHRLPRVEVLGVRLHRHLRLEVAPRQRPRQLVALLQVVEVFVVGKQVEHEHAHAGPPCQMPRTAAVGNARQCIAGGAGPQRARAGRGGPGLARTANPRTMPESLTPLSEDTDGIARRKGRDHHRGIEGNRARAQPVLCERRRRRRVRGEIRRPREGNGRSGAEGGRPRHRRHLRRGGGGRGEGHDRRRREGLRQDHHADQQRRRRRAHQARRGLHDGGLALHHHLVPDQFLRLHALRRPGDDQGGRRVDRQHLVGGGAPRTALPDRLLLGQGRPGRHDRSAWRWSSARAASA